MPQPFADSVAGHRAKFDHLSAHFSPEEAANKFVGGSDPHLTGFRELETLRHFKELRGSSILDIGCGIGRLTKYLLDEEVSNYVGLDIVPEILQHAIDVVRGHPNFSFAIVEEAKLPSQDSIFDIVCGFSLITHLIDEEIFEYFLETRRVLRPGGVAVFSFFDLEETEFREAFFKHARIHRHGHGDLLRFTVPAVLRHLANGAGFTSVSFFSGNEIVTSNAHRKKLLDGREAPDSGYLRQSVCLMRA
jgi:SAM-dependent methyltransferase